MEMNIETATSYASETNLLKALVKYGFNNDRYLVVCNREGRYTAIFPASACNGNMTVFARRGFFTLG